MTSDEYWTLQDAFHVPWRRVSNISAKIWFDTWEIVNSINHVIGIVYVPVDIDIVQGENQDPPNAATLIFLLQEIP